MASSYNTNWKAKISKVVDFVALLLLNLIKETFATLCLIHLPPIRVVYSSFILSPFSPERGNFIYQNFLKSYRHEFLIQNTVFLFQVLCNSDNKRIKAYFHKSHPKGIAQVAMQTRIRTRIYPNQVCFSNMITSSCLPW